MHRRSFFGFNLDCAGLLAISVLLGLVLSPQLGCSEQQKKFTPLQGDTLQYVGTWVGKSEQLEVFAQGSANYFTLNEKWRGMNVAVEGNRLVLRSTGSFVDEKSFTISKAPHNDKDGRSVMRLDGRVFEKQ